MSTPNFHGWTDEKAAERFALQCEVNNALVWAEEQMLSNERASREYIKTLSEVSEPASETFDYFGSASWWEVQPEIPF